MGRRIGLVGICLATAMAACASRPEPVAPPPSPIGDYAPSFSVRELAGPSTYLGPIPTAVILLKPDQGSRNAAFCSGYQRLDTAGQVAETSVYAANAVPFRWPMKSGDLEAAPMACGDLLAGYDYERAQAFLAALGQTSEGAAAVVGDGPFIAELLPDGSILVVSGSNKSLDEIRRLPGSWLTQAGSIAIKGAVAPDGANGGCVSAALKATGSMAERAQAWLRCEYPDGLTYVVIKDISCALLSIIGTPLVARPFCGL